uniref:GUN4-like domain-containing protein n=1 Tax=Acrosorium ciliolatum TaxID=1550622 RepID=A0A1Z1M226_9FLOR|nr:hypothetical protein [Acrosorium ciliolatum]ARW59911.1 hypothetical protein [Acrosorium ciliolatum]
MKTEQNNFNISTISTKVEKLFYKKNQIISNEIYNTIDEILKEDNIGEETLLNILINRQITKKVQITLLDGFIFEKLIEIKTIKEKIYKLFPNGLIKLKSSLQIDYQPLQILLIKKKFKEADQLTHQYLCKLSNLTNKNKREWLYFTDIASLPSEDLKTIDLLWKIYSRGKFGFSIQRKIWQINNYNWDKLWHKIGWIKDGVMRRYPQDFIWTINAPQGHLPLINQLRGTQVLYSLFKHVVWQKKTEI